MSVIVDLNKTLIKDGMGIQKTIDYVNSLKEPVYIVSGTHISNRFDVQRSLRMLNVKYTDFYLNPRDYGDEEFKYEMAKKLRPRMAIDNSRKARAVYRSLGINAVDPNDLPDMNNFWNV